MASWEGGPHKLWSKELKGRVGKNSRKPRGLTKNRHSDSLKKGHLSLSQGKVKKGDNVAVDDDDYAVRTSVTKPSDSDTL
jgi:hypothetical protein